jgi:hypothetical protein
MSRFYIVLTDMRQTFTQVTSVTTSVASTAGAGLDRATNLFDHSGNELKHLGSIGSAWKGACPVRDKSDKV